MPHVSSLTEHSQNKGLAERRALDRLLGLASLYVAERGDRDSALHLAEQAVALKRVTRTDEPLELATNLTNLGLRYVDLDQVDEAEVALREALDIQESRLEPQDQRIAYTLSGLSGVHRKRKEFGKCEPLLLRAAEIFKTGRGTRSAEYGISLSNLGALYGEWADETKEPARRAQQRKYGIKALHVTRAARGERHPETATRYNNVGVLKADTEDWKGATRHAERAAAIMHSLDLAEHPSTETIVHNLAIDWERAGQTDKAARLRRGELSDLLPVIARIEAEHRAWAAKDFENRHFGPPSPFRFS
jgi:tetratricopeptide (TPR) repeat protein